MAEKYASPSSERDTGKKPGGFGKFKLDVAESLARRDVLKLATYLSFPNADYDRLEYSEFPGLALVKNLESRGVISPTDISQLVDGLEACDLDGIAANAQHSYKRNVSSNSGSQGEKSNTPEEDIEKARILCANIVFIRRTDNRLSQKSTIELLNIASLHGIPIPHLKLLRSFKGFEGKDIILESGLCLSSLSSIQKISINGDGEQELSEEDLRGLINFGLESPRFKELWLSKCMLPTSINKSIIPDESKRRNIKVILSSEARCLDLDSGEWKTPQDIQDITQMCSDVMIISNKSSKSAQKSVIDLLIKASSHDIPIDCVTLAWSFDKTDEDGTIMLSSGLHLPILSSLEIMSIQTEEGRVMNTREVDGILHYVIQSKRIKELDLGDCLLTSISMGSSLRTLKSRGIKIFWIPDSNKNHQEYLLDCNTGGWRKTNSW